MPEGKGLLIVYTGPGKGKTTCALGTAFRAHLERLYRAGRYSPTRETGVHHFHRLLAELMAE